VSESLGGVQIARDRLLEIEMGARVEDDEGNLGVGPTRRRHNDRVGRASVEQLFDRLEERCPGGKPRRTREGGRTRIGKAHDVDVGERSCRAEVDERGDCPTADETKTEPARHRAYDRRCSSVGR
jgi:hypothetical protein